MYHMSCSLSKTPGCSSTAANTGHLALGPGKASLEPCMVTATKSMCMSSSILSECGKAASSSQQWLHVEHALVDAILCACGFAAS